MIKEQAFKVRKWAITITITVTNIYADLFKKKRGLLTGSKWDIYIIVID